MVHWICLVYTEHNHFFKSRPSNCSTDCVHAVPMTLRYGCTPQCGLVMGSLLNCVTPNKLMFTHRTLLDGETNCTRNLFFFAYISTYLQGGVTQLQKCTYVHT